MTKQIERLRKQRDALWRDWNKLPRKESFSGIQIAARLNTVQAQLDDLEGSKPSKRYVTEMTFEIC